MTWQWQRYPTGEETEEPFLVLYNRSSSPAYLKRARMLRGTILRSEASSYAFSYYELTDGNFPLKVHAADVSSFPLSQSEADRILATAPWYSRTISYIFRRPYLWVEVSTLGGRRLMVAANDAADFRDRPRWIDLRWTRPPPRVRIGEVAS